MGEGILPLTQKNLTSGIDFSHPISYHRDITHTDESNISEALHSIYAIHSARHNVVMLRIVRQSRDHMDNVRTLKEVAQEMQTYNHLGTLLTTGKYSDYINTLMDSMTADDVESLRVLYKDCIDSIQAENAAKADPNNN